MHKIFEKIYLLCTKGYKMTNRTYNSSIFIFYSEFWAAKGNYVSLAQIMRMVQNSLVSLAYQTCAAANICTAPIRLQHIHTALMGLCMASRLFIILYKDSRDSG